MDPDIAYGFVTYRDGSDRTCGVIVPVSGPGWKASDAHAAYRLLDPFGKRPAAARGKVGFLHDPESSGRYVRVFQAASGGAEHVVCGNATAAAACVLYSRGVSEPTFVARLPGSVSRISSKVIRTNIGWTVAARWQLQPIEIVPTELDDYAAARCQGLNEYLVVVADDEAENLVARLTETVRRQGLGAKAAVIEPRSGLPKVSFLNAGGVHGAAPLSGLIVLSQARAAVPAIAAALEGATRVQTAGGTVEELPFVDAAAGGYVEVLLPDLGVELHGLNWGLDSGRRNDESAQRTRSSSRRRAARIRRLVQPTHSRGRQRAWLHLR